MERLTLEDGTFISYERYGEGPPLVLVHGSMADHESWAAIKGLLIPRFTVYAMDRRGRGDTTAPQDRRMEEEFGDVAALIQAVGDPTFVLGHSFGAHCAMGGAAANPALVRKLVLYEPPSNDSPTTTGRMEKLEEAANQQDWDRFVRTWLIDVIEIPTQVVDALSASPFWPPLIADASATLCDAHALALYEFNPARFAALTMPVLLLVGTESPRGKYVTDALGGVLPDHEIVELQGQAHIAMQLAPQLFVETVSSFLLDTATTS